MVWAIGILTLIVIAIVLILTASVGFSAVKYIDKAKVVTARTQIETFVVAKMIASMNTIPMMLNMNGL